MYWIIDNINAIGAFAILLFAFILSSFLYKVFTKPMVRIIELNSISPHVHLIIMHNFDKFHVHLENKAEQFEFEEITYYWSPIQHTNSAIEVYSLCINHKGKKHELLQVNFTQKDVKLHSYG